MAPSSNQSHFIDANKKYAEQFHDGALKGPPGKKYTIVTCMDARIDPAQAFGIHLGDAHVIRNAGGSAKDALRSLIISEQMLSTNEILLVKHTACGMLTFTNEDAYKLCGKQLGSKVEEELRHGNFDFLPFKDLEQAVKDDVHFLQSTDLIPKNVTISGWVYEVESGKVKEVV